MSDDYEFILGRLRAIKRKGMPEFINWLEHATDLEEAPASTKYHLCEPGGLAKHSVTVFNIFSKMNEQYSMGLSDDTVAIVSLLHDACKLNYYVKDEMKGGYKVKDDLPLGHGEKSVIMILEHGLQLTDEEKLIIRWHMSHYEAGIHFFYPTGAAYNGAKTKSPAVVAFFI